MVGDSIFNKKVLATKAFTLKDGVLSILGIPGGLIAMYPLCYLLKCLIEHTKDPWPIYWMGFWQSAGFTETVRKRFGYKVQVIQHVAGTNALIGLGVLKVVRADEKNNHYIFHCDSTIAKEFLKFYGVQKEPIDYLFRGLCAGLISTLIGEEVIAVETKCIALGDKHCEVVIKPKSAWDLDDDKVKKQIPLPVPSPMDLGLKKSAVDLPRRG